LFISFKVFKHSSRDANPAKDLTVAFAEDDSGILTIDSSNA